MKTVYLDYENPQLLRRTVACIGGFDGFHRGHQELVRRVLEVAKERNLKSAVITFDQYSSDLFRKNEDPGIRNKHVMNLDQKLEYIDKAGIDYAYVLRFNMTLIEMKTDKFIRYLNNMSIAYLIFGFDFSFGHMGRGNANTLKNSEIRRFEVEMVDPIEDGGKKISSSRIISLIYRGRINEANRLLGHNYVIDGYVRGNRFLSKDNVIPKEGVFSTIINGDRRITGIKWGYIMVNDEENIRRIEFINEV
ncbi:MAG: adenylyltransferase/cytidyltransferase family protein [Erysipelotrichaceae bacterium]|nr:adenylyltransferase/cytidyltransferase family protein [Erysipelotrichaceae bacterium]